jgi:hypothetical protein
MRARSIEIYYPSTVVTRESVLAGLSTVKSKLTTVFPIAHQVCM